MPSNFMARRAADGSIFSPSQARSWLSPSRLEIWTDVHLIRSGVFPVDVGLLGGGPCLVEFDEEGGDEAHRARPPPGKPAPAPARRPSPPRGQAHWPKPPAPRPRPGQTSDRESRRAVPFGKHDKRYCSCNFATGSFLSNIRHVDGNNPVDCPRHQDQQTWKIRPIHQHA